MNWTRAPRAHAGRAGGICLAAAAAVLIPSVATAAEPTPPTILATVDANGAVHGTVQLIGGTGSAFTGSLPVTLKITHTASGTAQTFAYHVENTFTKTQTVHYFDTAGNDHHTSVPLQLPLVGVLTVDVPKAMGAITAGNATITTDTNGTRHVQWDMVLFSPVGTSVQDVSLTTAATGNPTADLRATTVDPATTAGLSGATQAATKDYQQEDFWHGYTSGAVGGLGQIIAGISQLHTGIAAGADGANQLDAGAAQAYAGSQQLSAGAVKLHKGLGKLHVGLKKIHGGLQQVGDKKKGLPTAVGGAGLLKGGVDQILAGVGSASNGTSLEGGLVCIKRVMTDLLQGTGPAPGNGRAGSTDPCYFNKKINPSAAVPPLTTAVGLNAAVLSALVVDAPGAPSAMSQLIAGVDSSNPKTPGVKQGLQQVSAGLGQLKSGLLAAVVGIHKLTVGSGKAAAGGGAAYRGSGKLANGAGALSSGIGQISAGNHQVALGLPAAVTGTQQLLDGTKQLNSAAIGPVNKQLKQASQNAHESLAVLSATGNLATQAPGGDGATYVLTQKSPNLALAASSTSITTGSSHTGRNVGIGIGAAVLLALGLGGGFVMGRRRTAISV